MKNGVKVMMYKNNGTHSTLILYFTADLLELNCVIALGEPVKNKWKLTLSEIAKIEGYNSKEKYK
jgi:hypothetical protein